MKKPIIRIIKTVIPAQDASVTSPIGPLLGQYGANIKEFCQKFNEHTQKYDENVNLMVNIIVYKDKTVNFEIINIVGSFLIFEEQFIYDKEKNEEIENNVESEKNELEEFNKTDEIFTQITLVENFKDILKNNGNKILYFFDVNSNLFFFIEFVLYFLSKKTFNDYYSQINFFFDFFVTGRFFDKTRKKENFSFNLNLRNNYIDIFFAEVDEFINQTRFKKKKTFFLQAGEDENKNDEEEDKVLEDEGDTLLEKNLKYFDLEKLEEFKKLEEMKKKKKPKNVSRIVKMEKYTEENLKNQEKTSDNSDVNNEIDSENDESFFYIPRTISLSVLYKIVKFKHFYNEDIDERILFRITASTILSMDVKIIDDVF